MDQRMEFTNSYRLLDLWRATGRHVVAHDRRAGASQYPRGLFPPAPHILVGSVLPHSDTTGPRSAVKSALLKPNRRRETPRDSVAYRGVGCRWRAGDDPDPSTRFAFEARFE